MNLTKRQREMLIALRDRGDFEATFSAAGRDALKRKGLIVYSDGFQFTAAGRQVAETL